MCRPRHDWEEFGDDTAAEFLPIGLSLLGPHAFTPAQTPGTWRALTLPAHIFLSSATEQDSRGLTYLPIPVQAIMASVPGNCDKSPYRIVPAGLTV